MGYNEISRLIDKYSKKVDGERWTPETNVRYDKLVKLNDKLRLFEGINSEYFRLIGSQKERAEYLIKQINFNEVCGRCSSEQIIVMICYFVKYEYNKRYRRNYCRKAFKDYEVTTDMLDGFLLFLVEYTINNNISDKNIV